MTAMTTVSAATTVAQMATVTALADASPVVATALVSDGTLNALVRVLGFGLFACVTATGVSVLYRGYRTRELPAGVAVLVGPSLVGVWLVADGLFRGTIVGEAPLVHHATGAFLLGTFGASAIASEGGRRLGDHVALDVVSIDPVEASGEAAETVRSGAVSIEVALPETIDDVDGYPPVDDEVKATLEGKRMLFPRALSVADLRSRLAARIERDFDVGHVAVDCSDEGAIEALGVGRRPGGLGPSLAPGTAAVAVRADPAPDAGTGDPVEVWTTGEGESRRLATGELRATAGDVATLAVGTGAVDAVDPDAEYRLATRPTTPDAGRELVSVIRAAAETVTTVTVEAGGPFEGEFVGWLPATVAGIDRDGRAIAFPDDRETLRTDDVAYVLGRPRDLRELAAYEATRGRDRTPDSPEPSSAGPDEADGGPTDDGAPTSGRGRKPEQ